MKKRAKGSVCMRGLGLYNRTGIAFSYVVLSLQLMLYFYLQSKDRGTPIQWGGVVVIALMSILYLVSFTQSV